MSDLTEFRQQKDAFFAGSPHSPLSPEQQDEFNGLNYFPENPALDLEVEVTELADKDRIQMQTTTGGVQTYERFGRFAVTADGRRAELTLFRSDDGFFLPFVDSLRGSETYGAGRYLEPEPLADGRFHVDFNYAYNPYCAYNDAWSCPITPPENRIDIPIRAGEKVFHTDEG
jgi:uncharacterized protein (DUF1684 family)